LTHFIGNTLKAGNSAVVVATESHRNGLLPALQAYGVDLGGTIEQGRYIAVDAADVLSTLIVNHMLDRGQFMNAVSNLILTAGKAAKGEHPRVALFGEGADLLWTRGYAQAAIEDEELCNELIQTYDVDILCGYSTKSAEGIVNDHAYPRICGAHSAVYPL
jgi:hypothetical protein